MRAHSLSTLAGVAAWMVVAVIAPWLLARSTAAVAHQAGAPTFDPAVLAAGPAEVDAQVSQALWEARNGALTAGIARLDAVLASPELAEAGRAQRERERLVALRTARDGWLARMAAEGRRLAFEHEGVRAIARLEAYEEGYLHLGLNRLKLERVAVSEQPLVALLRQADELPEGTPIWVQPYALLLGGEARWDRALEAVEGAGGEAQAAAEEDPALPALRADAEGMESLLREGRAAAELGRLSRVPLDAGSGAPALADAEATLARIEALLGDLGDEPLVQARRTQLRALAALALSASFDAAPVPPGLEGEAERTGAGALRLSYAFDRPEEADDFQLERGALPDWHASMTPVPKAPEDSYMIVKQGAYFGDGQLVLRHALDFAAPVRVSYTMRYVPREGDPLDVGVVMVGLGWDGMGSFVGASEFGDVYATETERGRGERKLYEGERAVGVNRLYTSEARLVPGRDGASVEAWREGELRNELSAGALERGGVFLFVHSPRIVAFEELTIEGLVDPDSLGALRARFVERELAALGL